MNIRNRLLTHLDQFSSAPFLFVGSGFSKRYVGLENWEDTLRRFATPLSMDFEYYASKSDNHKPKIATLMAEEFHQVWWNSSVFENSRKLFSRFATKLHSPLKIEIAKYVKNELPFTQDAALAEELDNLRRANIDGIITTNWDLVLENLFPQYEVFKSQDDLLFSQPQSIAEIYKIHGCCTEPNSLILTHEDYEDFDRRNAYLAAKLLTIFIEHPVIFLGYSLSDENIISVLSAIASCLKTENLAKLQDRLIFVQRAKGNPNEVSSTVMSLTGKSVPVTLIKTDDFVEVYRALQSMNRKFPARALRNLKQHIYELIKTNDPQRQMYVTDIEDEDDSSRIQVVYGVGVASALGQVGYCPITIVDLLEDVLFDTHNYDPAQVVLHTLPILIQKSKNVPVFKYLRRAGYFETGGKDISSLPAKMRGMANSVPSTFLTSWAQKKRKEVQAHKCGVAELATKYDRDHCLTYIPLLETARIDVDEFAAFLRQHFSELIKDKNQMTHLRKLVCLYDLIRHGPTTSEKEVRNQRKQDHVDGLSEQGSGPNSLSKNRRQKPI